MQTLNVGAGQSEQEYEAAEQRRRADLVADSRSDGEFFWWAACAAALGTGLLPLKLNIAVNIGAIDLLSFYGTSLGSSLRMVLYGAATTWIVSLLGLGAAARKGYRWAFLVGIVLYAADAIALIVTFSLLAFGVHAFFVYKWFEGQRLLRELDDSKESAH